MATRSGGRTMKQPVEKWQKVLYLRQSFPDTYIGSSFLDDLATNENVRNYNYWNLVVGTAAITEQICTVIVLFMVFQLLLVGSMSIDGLLIIDVALVFLCFAHQYRNVSLVSSGSAPVGGTTFLPCPLQARNAASNIRSFLLFPSILSLLSPVLRTLTESYAEDTVWALAASLSLAHLGCHDYTYANNLTSRFSGTISLNAACFTSVLLSSLLPSNDAVFAFEFFAFEVFGLLPLVRHSVKTYSTTLHLAFTGLVVGGTLWLLTVVVSQWGALYYLTLLLFITFVCPLWFLHVQKYKMEIRGPWDVAHVTQVQ